MKISRFGREILGWDKRSEAFSSGYEFKYQGDKRKTIIWKGKTKQKSFENHKRVEQIKKLRGDTENKNWFTSKPGLQGEGKPKAAATK